MSTVITFYSYKGGVGRTMALANIAVLLALQGRRVLAVDWDLEAPGLDRYFASYQNSIKIGLIDLLHDAFNGSPPNWRSYLSSVSINETTNFQLLASGRQDEKYAAKVLNFDWQTFFLNADGGNFIESLRDDWLHEFDVTLIDSRTGITDSGGVCTIQLPDVLVPVFTPNQQSLMGVKDVALRAQAARQKLAFDRMPLLVFPIVSRFDGRTEYREAKEWLTAIANELVPFYKDWLPNQYTPLQIIERTKLPYIAYYSFGEKLPVLTDSLSDPEGLGYAYLSAARLIGDEFKNAGNLISGKGVPNQLEHSVSKDKHWRITKILLRRLERLGLVRKEIGTSRWIPQERLLFSVIAAVPILILLSGGLFLLRKNQELQTKLAGVYGEIEGQRQHERELLSLVETSHKTAEEARRLAEAERLAAAESRSRPSLSKRGTRRLVQHTKASIKDFPWHVGLIYAPSAQNMDGYFCAGSLVNRTWILTAAYCVDGYKPNEIKVLTGTDNLKSGGKLSAVRKIVIHPQYKSGTGGNGIALINLAEPIEALPISLLSTQREEKILLPGTKVTVAGWGYTKEGGSLSVNLHQIDVPIVARSECNGPNSYNGQITNNMICAGADGVVDSCQGDGGAPLIVKDEKESFAAGVSGWGDGCGRVGRPGVYNRVSIHFNWISNMVSKD